MARRFFTGIDATGQRVTNLGDPSAVTDAANLRALAAPKNMPPGLVLRCLWNGTAWAHEGVALTARPTSRSDVYVDLVGAPAGTSRPGWALPGDEVRNVGEAGSAYVEPTADFASIYNTAKA